MFGLRWGRKRFLHARLPIIVLLVLDGIRLLMKIMGTKRFLFFASGVGVGYLLAKFKD